jgi:hypothetical protein
MKFRVLCVAISLALLLFNLLPPVDAQEKRRLAFALSNSRNANLDRLLQNPNIDGLALQEGWELLEPEQGKYRWESLDHALDLAIRYRKYLSIHLLASPRPPHWLEQEGAQFFSGVDFRQRRTRDVVPWDRVYLERYTKFLQTLASHLQQRKAESYVFGLGAVVPVAECNLVCCRGNMLGDVRYDRSAYLAACKQMLDVYASTFRQARIFISPPVRNLICVPEPDHNFFPEEMNYGLSKYGKRMWMFAADLNAEGSERTAPYLQFASKTGLGYQTIWSATDDPGHRMKGTFPGNLLESVNRGIKNGALYFEIYAVDVLNPSSEIQKALSVIHNR